MHPYLRWANAKQPEVVSLIQELVECESPSDSPDNVNRFVELLIERTRDIASAETFEANGYGRHLRLEFGGGAGQQILGVGHSDTVWPLGTLKTMPFRQASSRLCRPGCAGYEVGTGILHLRRRAHCAS